MLTENCEKSYFHERYQNLSKHLIDQIHQLISKFVFRRPVDHGTLKVEIVFFECISITKSKNYKLRNQMQHIFKGQLISKCLFGVFTFFQKTNENKLTSSKVGYVRSFFERIVGLKKTLRLCLTFR